MKHRYLTALLFSLGIFSLSATDYYVAKDGDDQNTGSESAPFLTLARAAQAMDAGDVCYIKAGTYREVLKPLRGGSLTEPQVWKAFSDDEVWIDATEKVSGWTRHAGDIWKATATLSLERQDAVYFDGELMDRARWPNNEDNDLYTIDAESVNSGSAGQIVAASLPNGNLTGGYIWYLGAHSGTSWTRQITSTSGNSVNFQEVDIDRWPFNPHNPTVFRNGNRGRFFVFGALDLLDYEREWFYDNGTLYLQAPKNVDPNTGTVTVAAREQTVLIEHDHIHIEGLNFIGGKVHLRGDHSEIRNNVIRHGLQLMDELDNTTAQVGNGSIHVQSSNNLIENNLLEYGSLNGIFVQGWGGVSGVTITQNEIRNFNTVGIHASPIRCNADEAVVTYNTIVGSGRDGVYMPGINGEFAYNDLSDVMRINNDGGLFYVVGKPFDKNTEIHHNWFHDSEGPEYADGRCAGIYLDNDSKGYDVHHNVVWNITWSAVQMNWDAWNNDIINNSFWITDRAMGIWLNGRTQVNNRIINNYANIGPWEGQTETTNLINPIDPFADLDDQDFMPAPGSALIDAGTEVLGITDGFVGSAPDIGAYELGGKKWVPGATRAGVSTSNRNFDVPRLAVSIFPNPASERTSLQFTLATAGELSYSLLSAGGRVVRSYNGRLSSGAHSLYIELGELPGGVYLLRGRSVEGVFDRRVVLTR